MSIHMKRSSPHRTELAEPFQVLSDKFLFAFQYLSSWDSTPLPLSYHLGLHICHKSHSFAEPVFLLHHYINLLRLPRAMHNIFTSPFSLHPSSSSKKRIKDVHGGAKTTTSRAASAPWPRTERSGKFPTLLFFRSKYCL
uniref:Uncharacterized protein n=1 Tax=Castor canadensis TaxID=51338 RepID=A0A8C0XMA9_CASCN